MGQPEGFSNHGTLAIWSVWCIQIWWCGRTNPTLSQGDVWELCSTVGSWNLALDIDGMQMINSNISTNWPDFVNGQILVLSDSVNGKRFFLTSRWHPCRTYSRWHPCRTNVGLSWWLRSWRSMFLFPKLPWVTNKPKQRQQPAAGHGFQCGWWRWVERRESQR